MLCNRLEACWQEIVPRAAGVPLWHRKELESEADMRRLVQAISQAMAQAGYSEKEVFAMRLALDEAIMNAYKHGHHGDWTTPITVRYHVHANGVVAQVEDQGPGFDPEQVPDPREPENLLRPSGRGLFLMNAYMSGVCHNERGNCVCFCKHQPKESLPQ
jgi:serine/threonine-protein kinase RsbW